MVFALSLLPKCEGALVEGFSFSKPILDCIYTGQVHN
jgi:hypothetical protein